MSGHILLLFPHCNIGFGIRQAPRGQGCAGLAAVIRLTTNRGRHIQAACPPRTTSSCTAGRLVRAGTALRGSAAGVPSRMPQAALSMTTAAKSPSSAAHSGMVPEAAALTITPPSRRDAVTASLQNLCLMSSQFIPLPPKEPTPQWPTAANSTTDNSVPFVVLTIIHL